MSRFDREHAHRSYEHATHERDARVPGKATLTQHLDPAPQHESDAELEAEGDIEGDEEHEADAVHAPDVTMTAEGGSPYDWKLEERRHRQYVRRRKYLAKKSHARTKARRKGKNWKPAELSKLLATVGPEGVICALNKREAKQGILTLGVGWSSLIDSLPIGALQPATAKALDQMVEDDVFGIEDTKRLFHVRFNHAAEDLLTAWTPVVMKTMWRQISVLPVADVTQNTVLTVFQAITGGGAFGPSWEAPEAVNTIQIGQDGGADPESLEHTVRHEIGHAVHAMIPTVVNAWLQNDMGFFFTDFDTWINGLGGYPTGFTAPDGSYVPVDDSWKSYLRGLVQSYTGSSSWTPAKKSPEEGEDANGQAAWNAMPEPVRNACAQSKANWYGNYKHFQAVGGTRYFLNHWYHQPFTMGPVAFACVSATNDPYTAMSEKEFFANCYAEYFQNPLAPEDKKKGHHKHKKHSKKEKNNWGGNLPAPVKDFFATCIAKRQPYDIFKTQPRQTKG